MTRKAIVLGIVAGLGLAAAPGRADIVARDVAPAATLLLPYFEVEMGPDPGRNTFLSINNAAAAPVVAHVVLWTDQGVPTLGFNVHLTGYDVVSLSVRALLDGSLPQTEQTDTPGAFSLPATTFPNCDTLLPPAPLSPALVADLEAAHTGLPVPGLFAGDCAGTYYGDGIARGYVTVDAMNECSGQYPGDAGYFAAGGVGQASNQNVLWGDFFFVDSDNNFAQGEPLVHIEADGANPETAVAGEYTFYGRYVSWSAADNREPLSSRLAARFMNGGAFDVTQLLVWRDPKQAVGAFDCFSPPPPLPYEDMYAFDEQETAYSLNPPSPVLFPAPAARLTAGLEIPLPVSFGWLYLNLSHTSADPTEDPAAAQAWVGSRYGALGRFSTGQTAFVLESAANASHVCINGGGGPPCP